MKPSERGAGHLFDRTSGYPWPADLAADIAEQTGCDEMLEACKLARAAKTHFELSAALARIGSVIAKHAPPPEPAPKLEVTACQSPGDDEKHVHILIRYDGRQECTLHSVLGVHAEEIIRRLTDDRPPAKPGLGVRLGDHCSMLRGLGLQSKWNSLEDEIRECCLGEEPAEGETG